MVDGGTKMAMAGTVRLVMFVEVNNKEVKMERLSTQYFLPDKSKRILIFEDIKEFLSAWASVVEILFNAYDPIPTVRLSGATGNGSAQERLQELEKLGWKKV